MAQYEQPGRLPSEMKKRLQYRTPVDAFEGDWPRIEQMLKETPGLQAKGLFEWLCEQHPGRYQPAQLSTPQRRLSTWKALHQHTVASLQQVHIPGKVMQTDGSWLNSFGVTIQGNPFRRILIHSVLPHSN